jgi:FkbM family methyltransferase
MSQPEDYVDAGVAMLQLGRWLQKHYPVVDCEGSQYDEDSVLEKFLPGNEGIYVDIGASHPRQCSSTWRFYQRGWRGLLIEPLPDFWGAILLERPEDYLCPIAASNEKGFASLRVCRAISSLEQTWPNESNETMPVQIAPLWDILKLYPMMDWTKTDFCSIDVEGHEGAVLEGFDWESFRPRVIMLEYRMYGAEQPGEDLSDQWDHHLIGQGYVLKHKNKLNQIWKLK